MTEFKNKPLGEWTLDEVKESCTKSHGGRCEGCPFYASDSSWCDKYCIFDFYPSSWSLSKESQIIEDKPQDIENEQKKQDKPRICEIFGVEVDERFSINTPWGKYKHCLINEDGMLMRVGTSGALTSAETKTSVVHYAINHPESIIRKSRLTESEIAICKAVGAKWVSRDICGIYVYLWERKPADEDDAGFDSGKLLGLFVNVNFPSIHPGDLVCVEEVSP